MTNQEIVERNIRWQIGDITVQLVLARARIEELESMVAALQSREPELPLGKGNGAIHVEPAQVV